MKLLTKEIRKRLPPLGSNDETPLGEMIAQVKFFTPDSSWTWYAVEFDGEDIFWGWVQGIEEECGTFSLSELQSVRGKLGLPVERDRFFRPTPLKELMKKQTEGSR
jgi:DUF2958 family protein